MFKHISVLQPQRIQGNFSAQNVQYIATENRNRLPLENAQKLNSVVSKNTEIHKCIKI